MKGLRCTLKVSVHAGKMESCRSGIKLVLHKVLAQGEADSNSLFFHLHLKTSAYKVKMITSSFPVMSSDKVLMNVCCVSQRQEGNPQGESSA